MKDLYTKYWIFLIYFLCVGIGELPAQTSSFWERSVGVNFSGVELRENLERFAKIQRIGFLLDRRIDPSSKLDFAVNNVSGEKLFEQLAKKQGLEFRQLGCVAYLGPKEAVDKLDALQYVQQKHFEKMNPTEVRFWTQSTNLKTAYLDSPKEILQKIAQKYRIRIANADDIPHDLWPELEFSEIPLNDLLLLLLIGFDATFIWNDDSGATNTIGVRTIKIVPIPDHLPISQAQRAKSIRNASKNASQTTSKQTSLSNIADSRKANTTSSSIARKRFQMMKVQNKSLRDVLDYLTDQVGLEVTIDEKSLQKKGIDPNQRISFELDKGNIHDVLHATLNPLKASYQLNGKKLRVY